MAIQKRNQEALKKNAYTVLCQGHLSTNSPVPNTVATTLLTVFLHQHTPQTPHSLLGSSAWNYSIKKSNHGSNFIYFIKLYICNIFSFNQTLKSIHNDNVLLLKTDVAIMNLIKHKHYFGGKLKV